MLTVFILKETICLRFYWKSRPKSSKVHFRLICVAQKRLGLNSLFSFYEHITILEPGIVRLGEGGGGGEGGEGGTGNKEKTFPRITHLTLMTTSVLWFIFSMNWFTGMESGWHRQSNIDGEIKALPTSESVLIQIFFRGKFTPTSPFNILSELE